MQHLLQTDDVRTSLMRLCETVSKLPTKEDYEVINRKLNRLLRKRVNIMPPKPCSFPLRSIQDVIDFNNISEEEYEIAVEYLKFLGGFSVHDAVRFCMKEAISDETIQLYSVWGERGNLPLFDTRLIKVIYDAVALNPNFAAPTQDIFFREVGEAVRTSKSRLRIATTRRGNAAQMGHRKKQRTKAQQNLLRNQNEELAAQKDVNDDENNDEIDNENDDKNGDENDENDNQNDDEYATIDEEN
ncbi:uncharacterized protein [Linepithema humile]|uniref:uncharacterized protein isoform X1 n=1 Tax=Linepithema humile TaxID=83485 RepID=UPI00351EECA2